MFGHPFYWNRQNWLVNPGPLASANLRPTSMNSVAFLRRDMAMTAIADQNRDSAAEITCRAIPESAHLFRYPAAEGYLNYDDMQFEDMQGNLVYGHACDVVLVEETDGIAWKLRVNPDGSVDHIRDGASEEAVSGSTGGGSSDYRNRAPQESSLTSTGLHSSATAMPGQPRPCGTLPSIFPRRTAP